MSREKILEKLSLKRTRCIVYTRVMVTIDLLRVSTLEKWENIERD